MSDYRIRIATEADFEDVMAFGDVYLGIDYLRHRYLEFMIDPNVTSYVYIVGEEIVGFCSVFLVDDGMTLLIRASRVKVGHQGQGIYGRLTRHVYDKYREIPSIKFEAFTTDNLNYASHQAGLKKVFTELSRKIYLSYRYEVENINIPDTPSNANVQEVTSDDMASIFEAKGLHTDIFPCGKIIIDWVPLRLLPSNMKYILTPDRRAILSKNDNSQISLLTVGTHFPCELGLKYVMDTFGSDATLLRHHLLYHLRQLKMMTEKGIITVFQVCIEPTLEKDADGIVKTLGLSNFGFTMNMMVSFEREFK